MDEAGVWSQIESLYRADFRRFERVARAITGDRDSALDAVQEGFADALRHADQWARRGTLDGWVWRCVVNRTRKGRRLPALAETPSDESRVNGGSTDSELATRLAALPERQPLVGFPPHFPALEHRGE